MKRGEYWPVYAVLTRRWGLKGPRRPLLTTRFTVGLLLSVPNFRLFLTVLCRKVRFRRVGTGRRRRAERCVSCLFGVFCLLFPTLLSRNGLLCALRLLPAIHPFHCWYFLFCLSEPGNITRFTVGEDLGAGPPDLLLCAESGRNTPFVGAGFWEKVRTEGPNYPNPAYNQA